MKNLLLNIFAITASAAFAVETKITADAPKASAKASGTLVDRDGKEVIYVSPEGKRLRHGEARALVKDGAPMRVHFDSDGEVRVVDRVGSDGGLVRGDEGKD